MAQAIIMPKAGMAMETGKIIEWLKKPGDKVEAGEAILEIETDKVAMEVEAEVSGIVLALTREAGEEVPVTETIGWIGAEGEPIPPEVSGADHGKPLSPPAADGSGRLKATPAARRLSGELGVPLESVPPGGPAGEIRAEDVRRARESTNRSKAPEGIPAKAASPLARRTAEQAGLDLSAVEGTGPGGRVVRRDVGEQGALLDAIARGRLGSVEPSTTPAWTAPKDEVRDLSGVRKVIAQRMTESHLIIPPVTLNAVAEVDALMAAREEVNRGRVAAGGDKLSFNDFVLKAVARALTDAPWMRVSLAEGKVVTHGSVNIGMAVAAPAGLMVPVIREADRLSVSEIHAQARDLAVKARERRLRPEELQGATFSVSNLGMYGVTTFTPIVNPPEAAILGVGTIRDRLRLGADGSPVEQKVCDLSLTVDHRLIDGAQGALFLKSLLEYLKAPVTMLV